jgi:putative cardiolipin synthase
MSSLPPSRLLVAFAVALAAVLAGCSSVPPLPERTVTLARTDTAGTDLGKLAAASLEEAGPGESGFRLLPTGDFAFDARLALARRAEHTLDVQYYHLANDSVGLQFLRELRDAAGRGVRVRLLVDDLYTGSGGRALLQLRDDPERRGAAVQPASVARRLGPRPRRRLAHEFSRINLRMHNKLFIADNRFSVSGGRNMADEYFMRSDEANFIDMDVLAAGPIVRELSQVFDRYWNSTLAYPIGPVIRHLAPDTAVQASPQRFERLVLAAPPEFLPATTDPLGRASVDYELSAGRIALEFAVAAVLADRPDKGSLRNPGDTLSTVNRSVLEELARARSELLIASPYFIPGKVGIERLREVIDRKVRIRSSPTASARPTSRWCTGATPATG